MRIKIFSIACVLASLSMTEITKAGDYYDDGYYRPRSRSVWYSSDCCYKRVTRHSSYYVRTDDDYDRRSSYDDYPRYRRSYYSDYAPRRYYDDYAPRRYYSDYAPRRYYNGYSYSGYSSGYSSYANYSETCTWRRTRIDDGRGGWVWGARRVCY